MKAHTFLYCLIVSLLCSNIGKDYLQADEYAVYSAYLNSIEKSPQNGEAVKLVVINNQIQGPRAYCSQESIAKYDKRMAGAELKLLFNDMQNKSQEPKPIEKLFAIKHDYALLNEKEFADFFKAKDLDGWEAFYKKYPNSLGYITLSRVGFNATFTKALVFRAESCGSLCGAGDYILFEKINDKWKEVTRFNCWIS